MGLSRLQPAADKLEGPQLGLLLGKGCARRPGSLPRNLAPTAADHAQNTASPHRTSPLPSRPRKASPHYSGTALGGCLQPDFNGGEKRNADPTQQFKALGDPGHLGTLGSSRWAQVEEKEALGKASEGMWKRPPAPKMDVRERGGARKEEGRCLASPRAPSSLLVAILPARSDCSPATYP